eukprot:8392977-Pyramimonas_sp.AAC.1
MMCGQRIAWVPGGNRVGQDGQAAPTAAEAARAAASSAQKAVDILQNDPQFRAGGAALTTVNQLSGLLQGLQWQLESIPEG